MSASAIRPSARVILRSHAVTEGQTASNAHRSRLVSLQPECPAIPHLSISVYQQLISATLTPRGAAAEPTRPPSANSSPRAARRRILDAARRIFGVAVYIDVTMREVAAEAGVAVQTFHAVFGSNLSRAHGIVEAALEGVNQERLALIR